MAERMIRNHQVGSSILPWSSRGVFVIRPSAPPSMGHNPGRCFPPFLKQAALLPVERTVKGGLTSPRSDGLQGGSTPHGRTLAATNTPVQQWCAAQLNSWGAYISAAPHASVAQMAERVICNHQVGGSRPSGSSQGHVMLLLSSSGGITPGRWLCNQPCRPPAEWSRPKEG